jgi:hypothetical protein
MNLSARSLLVAIAVAALVGLSSSAALGYSGATVTGMDVQPSDVPGPDPITVFPPPAAANMTNAQLLFDSSAELQCSPGYETIADRNWITWPIVASGVTINNMAYDSSGTLGDVTLLGVDNDAVNTPPNGYFTNMSEAPTDLRFASRIPRVGRYAGTDFVSVQFVLDQPAQEFGVYFGSNCNWWKAFPCTVNDDNNVLTNSWGHLIVFVFGDGDDFSSAQKAKVDIPSMYAPFVHVVSNGTDMIKSVVIVQDSMIEGGPSLGFFDAYVVPGAAPVKVGDINNDGYVNVGDLQALVAVWATDSTSENWNPDADLSTDGYVNVGDLQILIQHWGE